MARQLTDLQRERKLYRQKVSRLEKRGYVFTEKLDSSATAEEYREFRSNIYEKSIFVYSQETGEVATGEEGRKYERQRSARKAQETRARNQENKEPKESIPIPEARPEQPYEEEPSPFDVDSEEGATEIIQDFVNSTSVNHTEDFTSDIEKLVNDAIDDYGSAIPVAQNIVNSSGELLSAVQGYYQYAEAEEELKEKHKYSRAKYAHRQSLKFLNRIYDILHGVNKEG